MPSETINNRSVCLTILLVAVAVITVTAANCSTKKNYKLLSIFFDGVPDPNAVKKESPGIKKTGKTSPAKKEKKPETWVKIKSRHPDYFNNICNNCHDRSSSNFLRVKKKEDLCYTCHKPEQFTGTYVHGPVAVKRCLTCHLPHESAYKNLLRDRPDKVCASCHIQKTQPQDILSTKKFAPPTGFCDKGKDCTTCHYGHVADNRFFLKNPPKAPGVTQGDKE